MEKFQDLFKFFVTDTRMLLLIYPWQDLKKISEIEFHETYICTTGFSNIIITHKKKTASYETVSCVLFFKLLIAPLYKICQVFSFQQVL